jgi:hypothetical protein
VEYNIKAKLTINCYGLSPRACGLEHPATVDTAQ